MNLLLDTRAFLWWNEASPWLSRGVVDLLSDPRNRLFLSVVSAWEIVLKAHTRKLKLPSTAAVYIPARLAHYGIEVVPLALAHVLAAENLPAHHRDPFDRMLVAQSQVERLPIVTHDPQIRKYGADTVW
ncbi:MAG: type II toxin-antitoxin system VapC family toxin [Bryobacterales bacterium]|nr:type II toxin-antitoxin system VapC family toxin [Bryobacterales bacterium]